MDRSRPPRACYWFSSVQCAKKSLAAPIKKKHFACRNSVNLQTSSRGLASKIELALIANVTQLPAEWFNCMLNYGLNQSTRRSLRNADIGSFFYRSTGNEGRSQGSTWAVHVTQVFTYARNQENRLPPSSWAEFLCSIFVKNSFSTCFFGVPFFRRKQTINTEMTPFRVDCVGYDWAEGRMRNVQTNLNHSFTQLVQVGTWVWLHVPFDSRSTLALITSPKWLQETQDFLIVTHPCYQRESVLKWNSNCAVFFSHNIDFISFLFHISVLNIFGFWKPGSQARYTSGQLRIFFINTT